ncbi:Quinone oxidoreductase 2 [Alteromonas sp. 38]|uniref:SDR family oxidoreductase n=1 Tax=Alteromonas TaxID=226 RepID=UPI0012F32796|nr:MULTISPECIES: SDR family oxidoreductase [Alteromonas]CAD5265029.1 Quinone oxidoreductase 2 [Alteromonas sp. 154]VXC13080.1 Quinone oxidoreductase 2 [Alteromonas sp. 38]
MIAITGANGQLGQKVIGSLLHTIAPQDVVALVRSPEKANALREQGVQIRQADYNQPETLTAALKGVDKVLLISGTEFGKRFEQHKAVIDAAVSAGVSLLAYTSLLKATTSPLLIAAEHKQTEVYIQKSGIPAVILRNGWYSENYTDAVQGAIDMGAVAGAAKTGKLHTASRQDYADAAASVLVAKKSQAGKIYELAGDEGFTLAEYADAIGNLSGKAIGYVEMEQNEYQSALLDAGLPEGLAAMLADTEHYAAEGWLQDNSHALSTLIGRATTPITDTLKAKLA